MLKYVASLIALGFAGVALAQAPSFEDVDTNGDGVISQSEAAAVEGLDLATCDQDQSGDLSRDEYNSCTGQGQ